MGVLLPVVPLCLSASVVAMELEDGDGVVVGELMAVLLLCVCVLLRLLAPPSLPLCRGYSAGADN